MVKDKSVHECFINNGFYLINPCVEQPSPDTKVCISYFEGQVRGQVAHQIVSELGV